ncbi:hypothetical protein [Methylobacillus flagellatus]|uniref:hypothetical protein n=1 Tax=Methylobacillus flagellatus TaxID=405 RepID=UPI00286849CA|nr:hypothetical protein [Methylobacillus flagellatus]
MLHVEQSMATLSRDMRDGFALVGKQITEQSERFSQSQKPQWQAYGVMVTVVVVLGGLVYWPIREQGARIETALYQIDKDKLDRTEFVTAQERGKETRERINADILRGDIELQRQIDELKKQAMDTYSLRDVVVELKQNQKEMQEMVLRGRPNAGP